MSAIDSLISAGVAALGPVLGGSSQAGASGVSQLLAGGASGLPTSTAGIAGLLGGAASSLPAGLQADVDRLVQQYGPSLGQYAGAISEGAELVSALADGGKSRDEIVHAVTGSMAAAAGIIAAAVPVAGWIAGAITAVAAALAELINWADKEYGYEAVNPEKAGINTVLKAMGYTSIDLTKPRQLMAVDRLGLSKAGADGWVVDAYGCSEKERRYLWTRDKLSTMLATHVSATKTERTRLIEQIEREHASAGRGAVPLATSAKLIALYGNGHDRWNWLFGSGDQADSAPRPTIIGAAGSSTTAGQAAAPPDLPVGRHLTLTRNAETISKAGVYMESWHWRETDLTGISTYSEGNGVGYAFRLERLPADLRLLVAAGLLAPESQWPRDDGARYLLSMLKKGKDENSPYKQLLTYALTWASKELGQR